MFDINGINSPYAMGDKTRKTGSEPAGTTVLPRTNTPAPPVINNPLLQQPPVEQFQRSVTTETGTPLTSQAAQQATPQPADAETANPFQNAALMASPRGGNFERILAQVATVFFGSQKDKTDTTDEKEKRRRHDFTLTNIFGEPKVEESNNAELGQGSE